MARGIGIQSLVVLASFSMGACAGSERVVLPGHEVPLRDRAQLDLGPVDGGEAMPISISMQPRDMPALDSFLNDLYDPHSTEFHHYLNPQQFKERFGASDEQVQKVVSFLESQDLHVTSIASNNLLLKADGTVEKAQRAFGVTIHQFLLPDGRTVFANTTSPTLPADVAALVAAVQGMDNTRRFHPLYKLGNTDRPREEHPNAAGCNTKPSAADGFGPSDLQGAYDMTALGMTGEGETVGVVEFDGFAAADPACYFSGFGIATPPAITVVNVDGGVPTPGAGAIEVDLDIDILGGIAPGAAMMVYEEPNGLASDPNGTDIYTRIVTDDAVSVISNSWGECELDSGTAALTAVDTVLKQGAAEGISFFSAAGDAGAYDCDGDNTSNTGKLAIDSPGSDPYMTSVGGTTLALNAGAFGSEAVWGDGAGTGDCGKAAKDPKSQTGGGGGGISSQFTAPAWQTGTGVINPACPANGMRQVPDVTANADPASGDAFYCTTTAAQCTGFGSVGGTSAAAPTWAGAFAIVNQYLKSKGQTAVGYANPALYGIFNTDAARGFHDVTAGDNLYYPATVGFDMASGLGSPDIAVMAPLFVTAASATPTPSATATPTATPTPASTPAVPKAVVKGADCSCDVGSNHTGGVWLSAALALGLCFATRRRLTAR